MRIERLKAGQPEIAVALFALMARVLGDKFDDVSMDYADRTLGQDSFWVLAAFDGNEVIGGLTAHTLPMTKTETSELILYDIAVEENYQRRGVGRMLIDALRKAALAAGIKVVFVLADNADVDAISFYRGLRAADSPVTLFAWDESRIESK